jgi:mannose-1-phosphate guanylyltransferase
MYPKQFLSLLHDETMLQKTLSRLGGLELDQAPIIICNEEHRFIVAEQVRQLGLENVEILLEPVGRNTAPAIASAAILSTLKHDDPTLLVLSADHEIKDDEAFVNAVNQANELALTGQLITFGIVPTAAETGYGYIKRGAATGPGYKVDQFVEKPEKSVAEAYIKSGEYYWNSGMFMFKADTFLKELSQFKPDILECCQQATEDLTEDFGFKRLNVEAFARCESESVDYAVMEKTTHCAVVPMSAGWSDIGSWQSLWQQTEKDEHGNSTRGDVITIDTKDCYVHSENRLIATLGMQDTIVVETSDAILVANKNSTQNVKKIIEKLSAESRSEENFHRIVYRPWGNYDSVDEGDRYQVKRITVKPGAKLSVQMHHHRAEHWIVVSGTAKVYRADEEHILTENESIYIPLGHTHSLENPGKIPLEIIEVQSGAYLGEDDIVRFEDKYGRDEQVEKN